jgi:hypothetical protein
LGANTVELGIINSIGHAMMARSHLKDETTLSFW